MTQDARTVASATVRVENIGGIDETTVTLDPGVTALVGPNATNRTSLLQAIAGALGSDHVTLKSDASEGVVTLDIGEETYTRRLRRTDGAVEMSGDPYLADPDLVDLYAVLLNENEVRRAVRRGEDLRDLIMRPIDTAEIRDEIGSLVDERQRIDAELDRLDALADDLPDLEAERRQLEDRLEDLDDRLAEKRAAREELEVEDRDRPQTDVEEALDETLDELDDVRTNLERVEANLEVERKSLESLQSERAEVNTEYEALPAVDDERLAVVEERIGALRDRKASLESTVSELQRVVRFNEERLDERGNGLLDELSSDSNGEVTDQLLDDGTTTCWTCGSEVERRRIDEMADQLRDLRRQKSAERTQVADELAELAAEREDLEERKAERSRLAGRLDELDAEIDRREANVETYEARRAELERRAETLADEVEALQESQQDDLLSLQQEVSELTFERGRVAEDLADVEAEIADLESELSARAELMERRDTISEELTELRTRIDRIEAEAVEAFNTHMAALLEQLGYENIERIWIESTEQAVGDGPRQVTEQRFALHVVRQSDEGSLYEDRIEHLSESERELVGLVVALAGYLVHDVQEQAPFMLLDSLEMIDGERLVELVAYLEDHVPFLVVVLLPDHAAAFEGPGTPAHRQVTEI